METRVQTITTQLNDIPHIATTLWYSGCKLNCKGCHNTPLENFQSGLDLDYVKSELKQRRKLTDWLVYLGGNPLDSIESVIAISTYARELNFKQFLYSGYEFTEFQQMFDEKIHNVLLQNFDYLKTGKFDLRFHKDCATYGKDYFFQTLNQEVYQSQVESWEKFYAFDIRNQQIIGNFILT